MNKNKVYAARLRPHVWIKKGDMYFYAEISPVVKTHEIKVYYNKKMADAAALRVGGKISMTWPFTIIKSI